MGFTISQEGLMDLRDLTIIPKGRCPKALDATPDYVNKLEELGILKFTETPTGRKYTSFRSLQATGEWLQAQQAT